MASGPVAPTVNSVARTCMVVSGWVVPLGSVIVALVPAAKSRVAWRVPLPSVWTEPRAN